MAKQHVVLSLVIFLVIALALYIHTSWYKPKEQETVNFNPHIPNLKLSLDTASPLVHVSDDLLSAERVIDELPYPPHSQRFLDRPQVLTAQCVTSGTHYWELEAIGYWEIAVAHENINRTGRESSFGLNMVSWSLTHKDGKLSAYHNAEKKVSEKSLQYKRVAVTVGFQEGTVIFFEVGTKLKQLHMFTSQLSGPLCLGLGLYRPSRLTILKTYEVHKV
ncbi:E3 ubiquitin/ISG15 ligase TRIM25-like [Sardina pilchardus]|uniref:E3 ubiquitin/ISG15 ligase TRIM25-like n=1 Tax=Sardina pilchardus TaxID=27697 RepID=UPI002E1316F9